MGLGTSRMCTRCIAILRGHSGDTWHVTGILCCVVIDIDVLYVHLGTRLLKLICAEECEYVPGSLPYFFSPERLCVPLSEILAEDASWLMVHLSLWVLSVRVACSLTLQDTNYKEAALRATPKASPFDYDGVGRFSCNELWV